MKSRATRAVALAVLAVTLAACTVGVNMTPGQNGFLGMPWPNDVRRHANGTIDIGGFPGTWNPIVAQILAAGAKATSDFGLNSGVHFTTTGPVAPWTLPNPAASTTDTSSVMLVAVDPASPAYGERIPVRVRHDTSFGLYKQPNTLTILPYPGFPLEPGIRYAAIIFDDLRDLAGQPLDRAPLLNQLENPSPSQAALAEQFDAVKAYVADGTAREASDILAFTVFTTQDPLPPMQAVADAVTDLPAPQVLNATPVEQCGSAANSVRVRGELELPRWQTGVSPYAVSGGAIEIGPDGKAVLQGWERTKYEVVVPCGSPPAAGWPIVVDIDGTGAPFDTASHGFAWRFWNRADVRFVTISVSPYLSGDRADPKAAAEFSKALGGLPLPPDLLEGLPFFNYLNPLAATNNQRQQASDAMWLKRIARGFTLGAGAIGGTWDVATDYETVTYFGHSQGATPAPLFLAVDPDFDAAFLSAPAGGLYHAVLHRGDLRPVLNTITLTGATELEDFNPVLQLVQLMSEQGDGANYARYIQTPNLVMTEGIADGCSPREGAEHLAAAAGLTIAGPVLHEPVAITQLQGRAPVALPASGHVLVQLNAGHFGVHANPLLPRSWFESFFATGIATVPSMTFAPAPPTTDCRRYD